MGNVVNQDFYLENNCIVLTEAFLKRRGFCCKNSCRHCPYEKDLKLKTRYILKTSNDLQFDFKIREMVKVEEEWSFNNKKYSHAWSYIEELVNKELPFKVEIAEEWYTIISVTKINEV